MTDLPAESSAESTPENPTGGEPPDPSAPRPSDPSAPSVIAPHARMMALIVAVIVVADQLTKHWAVTSLAGTPPREVVWTLQWNLSFNSGMAFSQGQGIGPLIGAVAMVVILVLAMSIRRSDSRFAVAAGALIVGGAIGNLVDRLFRERGWLRGRVVDFIDFQWFPIFNIADSAITVGGVLFVVWSLRAPKTNPAP
jgi:signal peptidase II